MLAHKSPAGRARTIPTYIALAHTPIPVPYPIPPALILTMSTRYASRCVPVMHEGLHFTLVLKYDPNTRETTRSWVYKKEKVLEQDQHLRIPKAKSSGEKVRLRFL